MKHIALGIKLLAIALVLPFIFNKVAYTVPVCETKIAEPEISKKHK